MHLANQARSINVMKKSQIITLDQKLLYSKLEETSVHKKNII